MIAHRDHRRSYHLLLATTGGRGFQGWLAGHARQVIAWAAIVAGAYMSISGVVRLT